MQDRASKPSRRRRPTRAGGLLDNVAAPGGHVDSVLAFGALVAGLMGLGLVVLAVVLAIVTREPGVLFLAVGGLVFALGGYVDWNARRPSKR